MFNLQNLFKKITAKHVIVIGDIYLDEYIHGRMEAVSAEGPIPIVSSYERTFIPNAAGYTAMLLSDLGFKVHLAGVVGGDSNGQELLRILAEKNIDTDAVLQVKDFTTNCQTRITVVGAHYPKQDVLRVHTPQPRPLDQNNIAAMLTKIRTVAPIADAMIIGDKNKNVITEIFVGQLKSIAKKNQLALIGDSERNTLLFNGFDAVTANENEAAQAIRERNADADGLAEKLQSELKCGMVFLTRGAKGITVVESGKRARHLPTEAREVFDVNGAGEAVLAAVVAGKLGGLTSIETGRFANICAGLAVSKPGLAEISRQELVRFEQRLNAEIAAEKLLPLDRLKLVVEKARADKKRVVWTNGCYDIMHVGHILYLEKAKALGDILVVGLNSDASVRKYKGPLRPIVEETQRAKLLTSLTCVDYVVIFDDESPIRLIEKLHPDIYAKGGDYTIDTINQDERHVVEAYGGEIALLPGVKGMSTTNIIDKILEAYKD